MRVENMNLSRSEWAHLIDEWIFSERDRAILKRILLDGIGFEPLAEEFRMSVTGIKLAVYKAQEKLFAKLDKIKTVDEN